MAQARVLYEDGRPYTVPDSLEELTGPTSGVVELPLRLDWSEQGRYDLSDPRQRNLMYEVVIRESMGVEDLRAFLDGPTLARVWRRLWLPRKVRTLWESRFPPCHGRPEPGWIQRQLVECSPDAAASPTTPRVQGVPP
jgi:hypothetical protein